MTEPEPQDPNDTQAYPPYQPYGGPPPYQPGYPAGTPYPGYAPQPGYPGYAPQPGYAAQQGPSYPAYSPYPGYPAQAYPAYPYAPPRALGRPASATAAAVLGYVAAGLLILGSVVLFSSASFASDFGDSLHEDTGAITGELTIDGFIDLIAAALLIIGSVRLAGRNAAGRTVLAVGAALVVAAGIYWIFRFNTYGGTVFFAMVYSALVVVAVAVTHTTTTRAWLSATPASEPGAPPTGYYR